MGKRGPKPLPANVLDARGSWRAAERERQEAAIERTEHMDPPEWLTGEIALQQWADKTALLAQMRMLTEADREMLAGWCQAIEDAAMARDTLARDGWFISGVRSPLIPHPAQRLLKDANERMLRFSARFGFAPSDRVGLGAAAQTQEVDDFDAFVARGREMRKSNAEGGS